MDGSLLVVDCWPCWESDPSRRKRRRKEKKKETEKEEKKRKITIISDRWSSWDVTNTARQSMTRRNR
jgi:hypothetical protein